jgi:hypothetical protein
VRLLFCLFAEDAGIFPKDAFIRHVKQAKRDGSDLSERCAPAGFDAKTRQKLIDCANFD